MKNLLTATLPAMALLALGGCATSGALTTSTETDGVYYSSKDRTTAVAAPVYSGNSSTIPARALDDTAPVAATDDANPDYQGGTAQGGYATGTDYYSNSYNNGLNGYTPSGFNQPYTGPGVSSYNYSPGWAVAPSAYGSPFGYGAGLAMSYGYSPYSYGYSPFGYGGYGYGGGFYDPFYSPYGYGSGLSIGFGYGFGGFGGFGYPYGGYGYPYGYGGYGYRGYYDSYGYGGGYGGYSRPVIYANGTRSSAGANPVLVGPRGGRGGSVLNGATAGNPGSMGTGGGRGGYAGGNPGGGVVSGGNVMGRPAGSPATYDPSTKAGRAASTFGGGEIVGRPSYSSPGAAGGTPAASPNAVPATPNNGRRGFFGGFFGNGTGASPANANAGGQPATGQRRDYNNGNGGNYGGYSQPARRDYGSQPSYSQPARREASQPSYSPPSYSQPSRSGGSFGGGSFGGGSVGGGGGGGGRRGGR